MKRGERKWDIDTMMNKTAEKTTIKEIVEMKSCGKTAVISIFHG